MDGNARRRLVDEHGDLVVAIASRVHATVPSLAEKDDLVAWGTTGLLEAAERYDPGLGVRFSTFAYYRVRGAIYDGLRRMTALPRHHRRGALAAGQASEYLENQYARHAAAVRVGATPPDTGRAVRQLYDAARSVATVFVASLGADDGPEPAVLPEDPGLAIDRRRLTARLRRAVDQLPPRERHFIEQCYYEGRTVTDAGRDLGLSRSWSSRLHARAVDHLRDLLTGDE